MMNDISQKAWYEYLKGQEFSFRCPHCQYLLTGSWENRGMPCPSCDEEELTPTKGSAKRVKGEFIKFKRGLKCTSTK